MGWPAELVESLDLLGSVFCAYLEPKEEEEEEEEEEESRRSDAFVSNCCLGHPRARQLPLRTPYAKSDTNHSYR